MSNARNLSQGDTRFVNTSGDTMTGDLGVSNGGVHVTSPSGIEGLIVDTDQSNSAVSGRIVLKNNTSASSVYYSDSLGWTFHTGTVLGSTSGTQRMYLTPQGYLRTPYQPAFRAHTNASVDITTQSAIVYDGTSHNRGGNYNTSNGRFTAPVAGVYQFSVWHWHKQSTGGFVFLYLKINGSVLFEHRHTRYSSHGEYNRIGFTTEASLNANDYITVEAAGQSGGVMHTSASAAYSQFSGHLIG